MQMIDADAFREEHALARRCEDCQRYGKKDCDYPYYSARDFCGWLDDTPTASSWISVEDRLPEKDGTYIIYNGENVFPADYERGRKGSEWTDDYEGYCDFEATHWMYLPEPPED